MAKNSMPEESSTKQPFHLNENHLQAYYDRLFPFPAIYRWLTEDGSSRDRFPNREFTFIKADGTFIRYLSFDSHRELKMAAVKKNPVRIEIGPVYSSKPREKEQALKFEAEQKELVFDIDVSDYNDIRTCCESNSICDKCWLLMACAIKVVDEALREDFGFSNILWTFSGRRGIHCWVSDQRAKILSDQGRSAIAQYFAIFDKKAARNIPPSLSHHSIQRAYLVCRPYFVALAETQGWLGTTRHIDALLVLLPPEASGFSKKLRESWLGENFGRSAQFKFSQLESFHKEKTLLNSGAVNYPF